jgi:hypothetical protein
MRSRNGFPLSDYARFYYASDTLLNLCLILAIVQLARLVGNTHHVQEKVLSISVACLVFRRFFLFRQYPVRSRQLLLELGNKLENNWA